MLLPVHLTALQQLNSNICGIEIKLRPVNQPKPKQIQRQFSNEALNSFDAAAEQVAHHQELAETLQPLPAVAANLDKFIIIYAERKHRCFFIG